MPVNESETDRVEIADKTIHLKSYGLPMIFWGYLLAILSVILIMAIAIKDPIAKVISGEDSLNQILGIGVAAVLILVPLVLIAFFFYEKILTKNALSLIVTHKIFWLPILKKKIDLKSPGSFTLEHFLDSPNMARIESKDEMRAFENKGYFELFAISSDNKLIQIDRCSQKRELVKLKEFLSKY